MADARVRDLHGYGRQRPLAAWPGAARIAVSFVLNYEERGERNVLDGDAHAENYLVPEVVGLPPIARRSCIVEDLFDATELEAKPQYLDDYFQDGEPPIIFTAGSAMKTAEDFFLVSACACELIGRRGVSAIKLLVADEEKLGGSLSAGQRPGSQGMPDN